MAKFKWGMDAIEDPKPGHNKVSPAGDTPTLAAPLYSDSQLVFLGVFESDGNVPWECWFVKDIRRFDFHSSSKKFSLLEGSARDRMTRKEWKSSTPEYRAWVTAVKLHLVPPTGVEPGHEV